jgi:hypothetical protein
MILESFVGPRFTKWTMIVDIENNDFFFKFDVKGILCMEMHAHMVPFHYIGKTRRITKEFLVSRDLSDKVFISVGHNFIEIAKSLAT